MSTSQSKKYFNDLGFSEKSNNQEDAELDSLREKIKLEFSIINSIKANYSINVILFDAQEIKFSSEIKNSHAEQEINFEKFFVCDYYFERQQNIQIIINKNNYPISINTTLGCIIGARRSTYVYKFDGNETLIIKGQKMGKNDDFLNVKFNLKDDSPQSNYFEYNKLKFVITCNNKKIYSSEDISKEGEFQTVQIPTCLLEPLYTVSFYNSYNQLVVSFDKSIKDINPSKDKLQTKIPIYDQYYILLYDESEIIQNFTFLDYIKAGVRLALSIGIDFTGSNGHPLDEGTLHSIKGNKPNDYERAIKSCGDIVAYYDYDQLIPVYGFGAIVNSSKDKEASMCFNLNFSDNPDIYTINNVLKAYHECIEKDKLTFSGPTEFSPIIQTVMSRINENIFDYYILMILTDGVIDDLQQTIDILVEASTLPLSIIIVGIGKEDFSKMEILDGDNVPLVSSFGKKRTRDLVQFVAFSKFENDAKKLSEEVLAEIPKQIVEYYKFKNMTPDKISQLIPKNNRNYQNSYNYNNNNDSNYPSFEELQKKNEIDFDNIPINETVYLNQQKFA